MKYLTSCIVGILAAVVLWSFAEDEVPRLCPKCGWEADKTAASCPNPNCLAVLPAYIEGTVAIPEQKPVENIPESTSKLASRVQEAAKADSRIAAASQTPAVQLAAVRNSLAMIAAVPGAIGRQVVSALLQKEQELSAALACEVAACPECHGAGIYTDTTTRRTVTTGGAGIKKYQSIQDVSVVPKDKKVSYKCPFCGGSGRAKRVRNRKDMRSVVLLGRREYEQAALRDGRVEVAGVFMDASSADDINSATRAALGRSTAEARECTACGGLGTASCGVCGGFGKTRCSNIAFHSQAAAKAAGGPGTKLEDHISGSDTFARNACPVCGGTRTQPRTEACRSCASKGLVVCDICEGSGERAECRSCSGTGTGVCALCRGTGVDRKMGEPCAECMGERITLCKMCKGTGHGRR